MNKYCEFIGDSESVWDGEKKGKCEHIGFKQCTLHNKPLKENDEGWRTCCDECKTPYQIKE